MHSKDKERGEGSSTYVRDTHALGREIMSSYRYMILP